MKISNDIYLTVCVCVCVYNLFDLQFMIIINIIFVLCNPVAAWFPL